MSARIAKAKGAHDELIAAAHRAQADAVEIQALAKRRLADEVDAAQDRGDVATGREGNAGRSSGERPATVAELGLTRKQVHEARRLRDAEQIAPGIVRRTLDTCLVQGQEPTKPRSGRRIASAGRRRSCARRHDDVAALVDDLERHRSGRRLVLHEEGFARISGVLDRVVHQRQALRRRRVGGRRRVGFLGYDDLDGKAHVLLLALRRPFSMGAGSSAAVTLNSSTSRSRSSH